MSQRILAAIILSLTVTASNAALVSVIATGQMDLNQYSDPYGSLPFTEPVPNAPCTLTFTYDDTKPDISSDPTQGNYLGAIISMHGSVGDYNFDLSSFDENEIGIFENLGGDSVWDASFTHLRPHPMYFMELGFRDLDGTALQSDSFVQIPSFPSSVYEQVDMVFYAPLGSAQAIAHVDSLTVVPIPAVGWLLGPALGVLGWARRKASVSKQPVP